MGVTVSRFKESREVFPPWTVPVASGVRPFGRAYLAWMWMSSSFIIRDADWCTSIYHDLIPHPVLREGVVRKLINFVCWTMAIAQLMYLHLTIPASGSVVEPVPEECYPADLLPRVPVSFREVAVIESAPLCLTDRETDSLIDPALGGPASADQCLIQFHQLAYALFPGEDPMRPVSGMAMHNLLANMDYLCTTPGS